VAKASNFIFTMQLAELNFTVVQNLQRIFDANIGNCCFFSATVRKLQFMIISKIISVVKIFNDQSIN